jgi:hypothetical protein
MDDGAAPSSCKKTRNLAQFLKLDPYNAEYRALLESCDDIYLRAKCYFEIGQKEKFEYFFNLCRPSDQMRLKYRVARKEKDIAQLKNLLS